MKVRAAVAWAPGQPLKIEEVDLAPPNAGEVLIKIVASGVCHTDAFTLSGDDPEGLFPVILGHEGGGIVTEIGEGVTGFSLGERVSGEGHVVCGVCRSCRAGRRHLCTNTVGVGVNRDGCFAEYLSLPASNAWHVADSVPSRIAAIFDPFGNATHATLSFDLVGEDVLITGAGPIGIMAAAIA